VSSSSSNSSGGGGGGGSSSSLELAMCFLGLQASYLTWGYVQEKIMTTEYSTGQFPSATFCVFSNRILAVVVSAGAIYHRHRHLKVSAPLFAFAPCSFSNSLSSLMQYQALRYVSFPLQTLSKSTKVIPVMLVGKLLNGKTYDAIEYAEALSISMGIFIFSFAESSSQPHESSETKLWGLLMLALYLVGDSFTSQWQSRVYKLHPSVDQFQMMFATNLWSMLLALIVLVVTGELWKTLEFLNENPAAVTDNLAIAVTSTTGQLFIFYTIRRFGPVPFTVIMTTRQLFAVVISAIVFGHSLGVAAYLGAVCVFLTLLHQTWRRMRKK